MPEDAPPPVHRRTFELGNVFGSAFRAMWARAPELLVIGVLLNFLPSLVILAFVDSGGIIALGRSGGSIGSGPLYAVITGILSVLIVVFSFVLAPDAMMGVFLRQLSGQRIGIIESVRLGLSRFWTLIVATILAGLATALGVLFFIVPAIILSCGWFVLMAVVVAERRPAVESLSRSWALSDGYKWLILVVAIAGLVIGGLIETVAALPSMVNDSYLIRGAGGDVRPSKARLIVAWFGVSLGSTLSVILSAGLAAATYHELRRVREGVDVERVADIFA